MESVIRTKSFDFALAVIRLYKELQKRHEYVISKQLLRSGTSIGANVEEATAGQSRKRLPLQDVDRFKRGQRNAILAAASRTIQSYRPRGNESLSASRRTQPHPDVHRQDNERDSLTQNSKLKIQNFLLAAPVLAVVFSFFCSSLADLSFRLQRDYLASILLNFIAIRTVIAATITTAGRYG